ncbi:MAG: polysaccharide biosynthesis C-terminal domain-containing protein, partial [Treponema sp.]|nr:polysaccharide biosynthesis C-terminal domain-containing protein [Treponema sp.]
MKDMTKGPITGHLISYAVPLILGNFFQLTYNAVDSIILGRFAGKVSLAAAGIANPIMNIMIFFIVGICLGAGILMSEFYGAHDEQKLKKEISTTITIGFIFTLFVSTLCFIFVKQILFLIRTPSELIEPTSHYLRIVFTGLLFTFFYNVFASTLRAVGDSSTPIICVAISAVLNGILDYVLVAIYGLGMTGAAFATIFSQAVSCFLCIGYVYIKEP